MYRVCIADDNELARRALKKSVMWDKLQCEFCGEASNGREAMELILKTLPDIVLMDIKMPGLSGMEVIKSLQNRCPDIIYIMVTAYDDFEFMRQGLQMGVFDYILKPVSDQELYAVLKKAIGSIEKRAAKEKKTRGIQEQNIIYEETLKKTEEELEEKLFHDAINGLQPSAERLGSIWRKKYRMHDYLLMLVVPEQELLPDEMNAFMLRQHEIEQEYMGLYHVHAKGIWRKEGYVVCLSFEQSMFVKEYALVSLRVAEHIFRKNAESGKAVYITISHISSSFLDFNNLFGQTIFCKNGRFFLENRKIIHYDSMCSSSVNSEYRKMRKLEELYEACRGQTENIVLCMEAFLEQFSAQEFYDSHYVRTIMIQAAIMLRYIVRESHPEQDELEDETEIMKALSGMDSLQMMNQWMLGFAKKIQQANGVNHTWSMQTKRILDYLNLHYAEPVDLQEVADYMGISGTHVSRQLKAETGETFITLLNKIRIRESIRLLKTGKYKVYEIAELAGYSNYAYFYQIFKKHTGVSPKDYV